VATTVGVACRRERDGGGEMAWAVYAGGEREGEGMLISTAAH
jgi:hypothetical protein